MYEVAGVLVHISILYFCKRNKNTESNSFFIKFRDRKDERCGFFSRTLYKLFHGCRVAGKREDVDCYPLCASPSGTWEKRHRLLSRKGKSSWLKRCCRYLFALSRDLVLTLLSREGYPVSIAVCLPPSRKEKENVGQNKGVGKHKRQSCSLPRDFALGISFEIYFLLLRVNKNTYI